VDVFVRFIYIRHVYPLDGQGESKGGLQSSSNQQRVLVTSPEIPDLIISIRDPGSSSLLHVDTQSPFIQDI